MSSKTESQSVALVVFLAIGLGLFLLARRKPTIAYQQSYKLQLQKVGSVPRVPLPEAKVPAEDHGGMLHYKNKETRDIEWNSDGLPSKITIEREYYQLP